jgi:hypothetical protein
MKNPLDRGIYPYRTAAGRTTYVVKLKIAGKMKMVGSGFVTKTDARLHRDRVRVERDLGVFVAKTPKTPRARPATAFLSSASLPSIQTGPCVYVLQPTDGGPIKIGFTQNLTRRLLSIQAMGAQPLALLGTICGDRETERKIHIQLTTSRWRGEWYQPTSSVLRFLIENGMHPVVSVRADHAFLDALPTLDYPPDTE